MELHIGVDVGGTFTDITVTDASGDLRVLHKLPSTPDEPDRAIVRGIEEVLTREGLSAAAITRLSHGTTVGTNALIQRRVGRVALVTTAGFRDLLDIGRQTRPRVYDVHLDHPAPLVPRELRLEVRERMLADGTEWRELDQGDLQQVAAMLRDERVDAVVVCFLNAYAYPQHEREAVAFLEGALPGNVHVVASSDIYPEFREFERFSTAVLNAALLSVMQAYLDRFAASAAELGVPVTPDVSQSVGGLMSLDMARRIPLRASLSGPAAGVIGTAARAAATDTGNVITLDMGGTSADVSLLIDGRPAEVQERLLAGFPLRMPSLDVNAVGAGGGSIAWIDLDGLLKVGPQSAGALPGPACYGAGGDQATVTDANVVLGRLNGEALLDGTMPIDAGLARSSIERLAGQLNLGVDETALGIVQVTCAVMVKAVRAISVERGHDPGQFVLYAFGGAGPLHATEVARELDIRQVVIPANPGLLCAEGLLHSDRRADFVQSVLREVRPGHEDAFAHARAALEAKGEDWFRREGVAASRQRWSWSADLRYVGQNFELILPLADAALDTAAIETLTKQFHAAHDTAYGFASPAEPVELVSLRVTTIGELHKPGVPRLGDSSDAAPPAPMAERDALFESGRHATAIYRRAALVPGHTIHGPAVIEQLDTTCVVHPGDIATVDTYGNLVIEVGGQRTP